MNTRNFLAFGLIALLGAACGGSKSSGTGGTGTPPPGSTTLSCTSTTQNMCLSLTGVLTAADNTTFATECTNQGAPAPAAGSCTATSRVGRCTMPGTPSLVYSIYAPSTAADGAAFCAAPPAGTWTPG